MFSRLGTAFGGGPRGRGAALALEFMSRSPNKSVVVSTAPLLEASFVVEDIVVGSGMGSSRKGFVDIGRGLGATLLRKGLLDARGELTRSGAS